MQQTDATYRALLAAGAPKEVRARIYCGSAHGWVTYGKTMIVSATTRASMLSEGLAVGNCVAKELNLVLRNVDGQPEIPRMAAISMSFRLDGDTTWYPKGRYYIDTRDMSYAGVLTIDAYDAMLKTEQSFTKPGPQGNWPRTDYAVVQEIAAAIGVSIDDRTTALMTRRYKVGYPGIVIEEVEQNGKTKNVPTYDNGGAMSMRQVLGYVGAMYGGNWILTDENKLRLIVLGDIPEDKNLLIDESNNYILIGGDRIVVSR